MKKVILTTVRVLPEYHVADYITWLTQRGFCPPKAGEQLRLHGATKFVAKAPGDRGTTVTSIIIQDQNQKPGPRLPLNGGPR